MAKLNSFEEIIAWQKARELNADIYKVTNNNEAFNKDYGLKDQMRRASVSISSNMRKVLKERRQENSFGFYTSLKHLLENSDLNYI